MPFSLKPSNVFYITLGVSVTATVAVLNALWLSNDFQLPYLKLAKPITIPLSQMYFYGKYNQQWHLIMAGFVVSTLPTVIFYLIMQKYIIKGIVIYFIMASFV